MALPPLVVTTNRLAADILVAFAESLTARWIESLQYPTAFVFRAGEPDGYDSAGFAHMRPQVGPEATGKAPDPSIKRRRLM